MVLTPPTRYFSNYNHGLLGRNPKNEPAIVRTSVTAPVDMQACRPPRRPDARHAALIWVETESGSVVTLSENVVERELVVIVAN
jgi:hypothetical protein